MNEYINRLSTFVGRHKNDTMIKEKTMAKVELAIIIIMTLNAASAATFIWDDYCMGLEQHCVNWIWMIVSAIYLVIWLNISNFVKRGLAVDI